MLAANPSHMNGQESIELEYIDGHVTLDILDTLKEMHKNLRQSGALHKAIKKQSSKLNCIK